MERLKRSVDPTDILERHTAVVESVTESPLTKGNKVALLADGQATYAAMFKAMQNAKDHINLESYIIEDDETGRQFADLLLQKQAEGVQINLIYDSVGSMNTPASFFQRLRDGGIQVVGFNPINPLEARGEMGTDTPGPPQDIDSRRQSRHYRRHQHQRGLFEQSFQTETKRKGANSLA